MADIALYSTDLFPDSIVCTCAKRFQQSADSDANPLQLFLAHCLARQSSTHHSTLLEHRPAIISVRCVFCSTHVDINSLRQHLDTCCNASTPPDNSIAYRAMMGVLQNKFPGVPIPTFECDECLDREGNLHLGAGDVACHSLHAAPTRFELFVSCRVCESKVPLDAAIGHALDTHQERLESSRNAAAHLFVTFADLDESASHPTTTGADRHPIISLTDSPHVEPLSALNVDATTLESPLPTPSAANCDAESAAAETTPTRFPSTTAVQEGDPKTSVIPDPVLADDSSLLDLSFVKTTQEPLRAVVDKPTFDLRDLLPINAEASFNVTDINMLVLEALESTVRPVIVLKAPHDDFLTCKTCGATLKTTDELWSHVVERCGTDRSGPASTVSGDSTDFRRRAFPPGKLICSTCNKPFATQQTLKTHQHIHTGERFFCEFCTVSYTTKPQLVRHMQQHGGAYACHRCPLRFFMLKQRQDHVSAVHSALGTQAETPENVCAAPSDDAAATSRLEQLPVTPSPGSSTKPLNTSDCDFRPKRFFNTSMGKKRRAARPSPVSMKTARQSRPLFTATSPNAPYSFPDRSPPDSGTQSKQLNPFRTCPRATKASDNSAATFSRPSMSDSSSISAAAAQWPSRLPAAWPQVAVNTVQRVASESSTSVSSALTLALPSNNVTSALPANSPTNDAARSATAKASHKCSKCEQSFGSAESLRLHNVIDHFLIQRSTSTVASTPDAPQVTPSGESSEHSFDTFVGGGAMLLYPCSLCDAAFRLPKERIKHMLKHGGAWACVVCQGHFPNEAALFQHILAEHQASDK